jgi:hypothetical protein
VRFCPVSVECSSRPQTTGLIKKTAALRGPPGLNVWRVSGQNAEVLLAGFEGATILGQPAMKLLHALGDEAAGAGGVQRACFVAGALPGLHNSGTYKYL